VTDDDVTLWDTITLAATIVHEETIDARFQSFHADNPRVYELLVRFSLQLKHRGYEHAGISLIWERMRWEMSLETVDPDGFKLNNDYRSRYARLLMASVPSLEGFFRTRELRAA
jgi:hypothetical protein